MFPTDAVAGSSVDGLLLFLGVLGILLLIATALRLKVPFLKKYYIPASLLAGIIGLILGPNVIGLIPKPIISTWSTLSGKLIVPVYATLLMSKKKSKPGKVIKNGVVRIILNYHYTAFQYWIPLLLGVICLTPLFAVPDLFGTIVDQGWAGGHGTAGGMQAVFEELGWADGASLATTSATIGLMTGIIGGVILINFAMRKGWSGVQMTSASLQNTEEEIYTAETGKPNSIGTLSSSVMDSMTFHLSLVGVAMLIGWFITKLVKTYLNFSLSWFITAMLGGLVVKLLISKTKWADAVDNKSLGRIQGVCLDFLVAGAVASVNIPVVVKYWAPLLIQQGLMIVLMVLTVVWLGRRVFGQYWFENSISIFGSYTGVSATGLMLLRTCDPEGKSDALEVIAVSAAFTTWAGGGGLLTSITPGFVAKYGAFPVALVYLGIFVVLSVVLRIFFWNKPGKVVNEASAKNEA